MFSDYFFGLSQFSNYKVATDTISVKYGKENRLFYLTHLNNSDNILSKDRVDIFLGLDHSVGSTRCLRFVELVRPRFLVRLNLYEQKRELYF